jgi:hypothetical protein
MLPQILDLVIDLFRTLPQPTRPIQQLHHVVLQIFSGIAIGHHSEP